MSDRVLITGGGGFIGAHLASALADRDWQVDIVDNFSRGVEDNFLAGLVDRSNVALVSGDLLEQRFVGNLDDQYAIVIHLAAIIGVRHVLERPYDVLRDNVRMTTNALDLGARQENLKRFVFASTSEITAGGTKAFGNGDYVPAPEDAALALADLGHPRTTYMLSKIYGEAMCRHSDLPFTIVRPFNVYGPRMGSAHVIPELLKRAHEQADGGSLEVASTSHRRAFCYLDDAIEMILRLIDSDDAVMETFNVGNQRAETSIGALADIVLATVDRDLEIVAMPPTPGSPEHRCPDMSKTVSATRYTPAIGVEEGVARTYAWYRDTVFEGGEITAQ